MKIIVAMDSFKGSLSSLEAGEAVRSAALSVFPESEVIVLPLADGGEGTVDALTSGLGGEMVRLRAAGPLGDEIYCRYGISPDGTAVIEMAECSGLSLVPQDKRDPLNTTTYGLGQLILDALDRGCRSFIIGIGGSATNDLGTGMLSALGVKFFAGDEELRYLCGGCLESISRIDISSIDARLARCSFRVACDVNNTLLGERGCARVYGPQKGADEERIVRLDRGAQHFAELAAQLFNKDMRDIPGAGAAGGLGYGFVTFLPASLEPGVEIVLSEVRLKEKLAGADMLITGEGRIDRQTAMGKGPMGAAKLARAKGVKTVALGGCVSEDADICNAEGFDAYFSIIQAPCTIEQAMEKKTAKKNLINTARQVFKLLAK